tara:strand:+ start:2607 stop:3455 length:849 start_codon:yes stop_codon:yes gene_type:complete
MNASINQAVNNAAKQKKMMMMLGGVCICCLCMSSIMMSMSGSEDKKQEPTPGTLEQSEDILDKVSADLPVDIPDIDSDEDTPAPEESEPAPEESEPTPAAVEESPVKTYSLKEKSTGANDWGGGNTIYWDRHPMKCETGVFNQWQLTEPVKNGKIEFKYKCLEDTGITSSKSKQTDCKGDNGGDARYLREHDVDCEGSPLTNIVYGHKACGRRGMNYSYNCGNKTSDTCRDANTEWADLLRKSTDLTSHNLKCNDNEYLSRFKLVKNTTDDRYRYDYKCCKP